MKRAFLSHFVICCAVAGLAYYAWAAGALGAIWRNDQSYMAALIGALLVLSMAYIGWQAWRADEGIDVNPEFGHLAQYLAPAFGLLGTATGLSLQAKALAGGSTSFVALATSLYCTGCGIAALIVLAIATYSLEQGIARRAP